MGRKEDLNLAIGLLSLLIALASCMAAWLALPQLQPWLNGQLENPLFLPLVAAVTLVVLLALVVIYLRWDQIVIVLRMLVPSRRLERRYLAMILASYNTTWAMQAGKNLAVLNLLEAYSPLILRPDRDGDLGDGHAADGSEPDAPHARAERFAQRRYHLGEQLVYWVLWAVAQTTLLALAAAVLFWLLRPSADGWQFDWWRVVLGLLLVGLWLFGALRLHGWLVADDDVLKGLLRWWRERRECRGEAWEPGYELWKHKRLLIKGAPGSGKTTLLRYLALVCAIEKGKLTGSSRAETVRDTFGWPICPFPIYIPLRALDLSNRDIDLLTAYVQYLRQQPNEEELDGCTTAFFRNRLKQGDCLILLDAFDELADTQTRTRVARMIANLHKGPKGRENLLVVSSRIIGYGGELNNFVQRRVAELRSSPIFEQWRSSVPFKEAPSPS